MKERQNDSTNLYKDGWYYTYTNGIYLFIQEIESAPKSSGEPVPGMTPYPQAETKLNTFSMKREESTQLVSRWG